MGFLRESWKDWGWRSGGGGLGGRYQLQVHQLYLIASSSCSKKNIKKSQYQPLLTYYHHFSFPCVYLQCYSLPCACDAGPHFWHRCPRSQIISCSRFHRCKLTGLGAQSHVRCGKTGFRSFPLPPSLFPQNPNVWKKSNMASSDTVLRNERSTNLHGPIYLGMYVYLRLGDAPI